MIGDAELSNADYLGISFSDFARQLINRNINVSMGIDAEVNRQAKARAAGGF
jgi:hypothetical protein